MESVVQMSTLLSKLQSIFLLIKQPFLEMKDFHESLGYLLNVLRDKFYMFILNKHKKLKL